MITTILSHEVKDFATWKSGFDAGADARSQAGVNVSGVYQSVENPNAVTLIAETSSMEVIQGFLGNAELQASMEQAGVIGMPEVKILNSI